MADLTRPEPQKIGPTQPGSKTHHLSKPWLHDENKSNTRMFKKWLSYLISPLIICNKNYLHCTKTLLALFQIKYNSNFITSGEKVHSFQFTSGKSRWLLQSEVLQQWKKPSLPNLSWKLIMTHFRWKVSKVTFKSFERLSFPHEIGFCFVNIKVQYWQIGKLFGQSEAGRLCIPEKL